MTTDSSPQCHGFKPDAQTDSPRDQPFLLLADLRQAAIALALRNIELAPKDGSPAAPYLGICNECLRASISWIEIPHVTTCETGRVLRLFDELREATLSIAGAQRLAKITVLLYRSQLNGLADPDPSIYDWSDCKELHIVAPDRADAAERYAADLSVPQHTVDVRA